MACHEIGTLWFMERNSRFEHEKPFLFTYPLDDGVFPSNLKHEARSDISIRNLRDYVPSYDHSGIGLLSMDTGLSYEDYDDATKVETVLLPRARQAMMSFLGAKAVHIIEYKVSLVTIPI